MKMLGPNRKSQIGNRESSLAIPAIFHKKFLCLVIVGIGSLDPPEFGRMVFLGSQIGCVFENRVKHFMIYNVAHNEFRHLG